MFHKIGKQENSPFNVSARYFEEFLISANKKGVISLSQFSLAKEKSYRNKTALTFDDVSDSFYENAFPILKKLNLPFTIFVATSLLDKPSYITTQQLQEIAKSNLCTIGSHGVSHTFFRRMSKEERKEEFRTSKIKLQEITNREIRLFAFPYGTYYACGLSNNDVLDFYDYAFSTIPFPLGKSTIKPYFLPRINAVEGHYILKQ